jgi:Glyoxalase/Bleomycin resistance protein/Dioxygenase superfamily
VQLALNVDDLTESVAFYTKLFGIEPAKVRPGYANWASLLGRVSVAARGHRVRMGRKARTRVRGCCAVSGPCQPRLVMNSAIAAYWHAAAAQTQA